MTCRKLTIADFNDAGLLYQELSGDIPVAGKGAFETMLMHQGTFVFGFEKSGYIVSMATLHLLPNMTQGGRPYGLVENVVTLRAEQGRGYGHAVMKTLIDVVWRADAYKIMLLTGQLHGAKGFYERIGFNANEKFGMSLRRVAARKL